MTDPRNRRKRRLVCAAGFLYTLSLHKYFIRNPLSPGGGTQGYIEATLICAALVCCFIAARPLRRRRVPFAIGCFIIVGLLAFASTFRSFNVTLSLGEGVLLFCVLGVGVLSNNEGHVIDLFRAIYWTYTASLIVGLLLGILLPSHFALFRINGFNGRTRLSVFDTFPGTMGETAAYLLLLAPIIFNRPHRLSWMFLLFINLAAGGKVSTVTLLLLLTAGYLAKIRSPRSPRLVFPMIGAVLILCFSAIFTLAGSGVYQSVRLPLKVVYGHDIAAEAVGLDGRLNLWKGVIQIIVDNPALGHGFDGARNELIQIASWSGQSHNGFLGLGLAAGIPAVGIFLLALISVFRASWRSSSDIRRRTLIPLVYMIVIAFTGITFTAPSYFGILVLIFLLYQSGPLQERYGAGRIEYEAISTPKEQCEEYGSPRLPASV